MPTTKPVPKADATVSAAHNNARPAPAARVLGLDPHVQAKAQPTHHVVMHRATAARHHAVMLRPQVRAHLTAPVARSEPAQAWVPVRGLGRVPVRQVAQPPVAPVAIRQIAHVARLSLASNLHAHRLAAPACKIRHYEYSN